MRHYKLLLALLFLGAGCAHETNSPNGRVSAGPEGQMEAGAKGASAQASTRVPPLVDYHQHLMSPANAELVNGESLPPVTLPAELATFLQKRETEWNDKEALAALYTEDSTLFLKLSPTEGWVRGRSRVAPEPIERSVVRRPLCGPGPTGSGVDAAGNRQAAAGRQAAPGPYQRQGGAALSCRLRAIQPA